MCCGVKCDVFGIGDKFCVVVEVIVKNIGCIDLVSFLCCFFESGWYLIDYFMLIVIKEFVLNLIFGCFFFVSIDLVLLLVDWLIFDVVWEFWLVVERINVCVEFLFLIGW